MSLSGTLSQRKTDQPGRPAVRKSHFLSPLLAVLLLLSLLALPARPVSADAPPAKIGPRLLAKLAVSAPDDQLPVIIRLANSLDPQQAAAAGPGNSTQERLIRGLQAHADVSQKNIRAYLQNPALAGRISRLTPFWIVDGLALNAAPDVIQSLAARSDVAGVELQDSFTVLLGTTSPVISSWDNLGKIGARQLWALGITGHNVVVATLDTGVDITNPELTASWRGGSNSWYDPTGVHKTPADLPAACGAVSGHGTGTMGVMAGKTVGVAPGVQWIAAKIFEDNCSATTADILSSFQWVLDPDGNPATADAPQVVNNSWGSDTPGCDTSSTYQPAIQALLTAGIVPVFAAGNSGSGASSGVYPATNAGAFPVGATDQNDLIAPFSSQGPNTCLVPSTIFPTVSAPGVNITTAGIGSSYVTESGTSFSAPHVAGALALLLSAAPGISVQQQEGALAGTAVDLGTAGLDNTYGYGRINVLAAAQSLLPVKISFAVNAAAVLENGGPVNVGLQLNQAATKPVTVTLAASGGTAVNGVDYSISSPTVTFNPGETAKSIAVNILNDGQADADETLLLRLANPVNAIAADAAQVETITIQDTNVQANFAAPAQSVNPTAGTISVAVTRSGGLDFPVTVNCFAAGGTAVEGLDYAPLSSTVLTFAAGETQKSFPVTLLPNTQAGSNKTLILGLNVIPSIGTAAAGSSAAQMTLTMVHTGGWQLLLPLVLD
ncbi:MAG TPA: S8 family serine peptidase [Anaerolineaceae bacterium]